MVINFGMLWKFKSYRRLKDCAGDSLELKYLPGHPKKMLVKFILFDTDLDCTDWQTCVVVGAACYRGDRAY